MRHVPQFHSEYEPNSANMVQFHAEQGLPGYMHQLSLIGKPLHMLFKDSCTEIEAPTVELHPLIRCIDLTTINGDHQVPDVRKVKHSLVETRKPVGILPVENRGGNLVESVDETSTMVRRFPFTGKPTVTDISVSN